MKEKIETYTALVMQPEINVARDRVDIEVNLARCCDLIDFGVNYLYEHPVRLVVFPEYFLQGMRAPGKGEDGLKEFMKKAITIPGPELDRLGQKAKEHGLYIAGGGVVEQVPEFPDRWFNTAFIIGPSGDVILRYHKWHIPSFIGLGTSPHDLLDAYIEAFGNEINTFFPVVDTAIGKLGTMTFDDGATPEVSRALGFNGAEVICHPGAIQEVEGVSQPWDLWRFTRRTRAHDNMCYLLCANWGKVNYAYYPKAFCPGNSMAIDYMGMVMKEAPYPEEQVIAATINIEGLREHRTVASHNMWIDVRTEVFRKIYEEPIYPANQFPPGTPPPSMVDKLAGANEVYRRLYERGQFTPPYPYTVEEMPEVLEKRLRSVQGKKGTGTTRKDS